MSSLQPCSEFSNYCKSEPVSCCKMQRYKLYGHNSCSVRQACVPNISKSVFLNQCAMNFFWVCRQIFSPVTLNHFYQLLSIFLLKNEKYRQCCVKKPSGW